MRRIYLDHTATTPLDERVFAAMEPYLHGEFGNASSIHHYGRQARAALDTARDTIAHAIGAKAGELYFTSGGTESDNTALKGAAWKMRDAGKTHIVTTAIEHHAVLDSCEFLEEIGFAVTRVAPDASGMIHADAIRAAMRPETGLVSVMHANNEVGAINDIAAIGAVVHEAGALFHTDAVQTLGKLPIDCSAGVSDLMSFSAHKIYGPKGIGALYIHKGANIERFMHGGGQERGRRAGTENVPAAVGFAKALELVLAEREGEAERLKLLTESLYSGITANLSGVIRNGNTSSSLSHILNISFDEMAGAVDGEALLFNLDLAGVAVTSGSACTSGSMDPSHVLLAMGVPPATAKATIRFSLGRMTTEEEIAEAVRIVTDVVGRLRGA